MEIYIPYIIGGSISSILGSVSYYLSSGETDNSKSDDPIEQSNITDNLLDSSKPNILHEYSIINESLKEQYYYSDKYTTNLGSSTTTKFKNILKILHEECHRKITLPIKNNKKQRLKLFRYIQEYGNIGHYQFIDKYKKYNKYNK